MTHVLELHPIESLLSVHLIGKK